MEDAEKRLVLVWTTPLRHATFYKAVFRPAVLRANRTAGNRPIDIAALMGHRDVKTTLTVYAHLINTDDHTRNMAALGALAAPATPENVVALRKFGNQTR